MPITAGLEGDMCTVGIIYILLSAECIVATGSLRMTDYSGRYFHYPYHIKLGRAAFSQSDWTETVTCLEGSPKDVNWTQTHKIRTVIQSTLVTYYINQFNKCQHFETDISDLRTCRPI